MYAAVDVGGTKTLLAALDDNGVILQKIRFETPKDYQLFVLSLKRAYIELDYKDFTAAGVGAPGKIDREHGRGIRFGNLPWENVPLHDDVAAILNCPVVVENDAKMAALSEAMMVKDEPFRKVLYVTVSTGIGYGLVADGHIDDNFSDVGGKSILLEHGGKLVPWESYASGHAIVDRYGKRAEDIHDEETWRKIVRDLVPGFLELTAICEPDLVVIGGGVGTYFERYGDILRNEMKRFETPMITMPEFRGAARAEEAVLFGCYDLAKEKFSALPR